MLLGAFCRICVHTTEVFSFARRTSYHHFGLHYSAPLNFSVYACIQPAKAKWYACLVFRQTKLSDSTLCIYKSHSTTSWVRHFNIIRHIHIRQGFRWQYWEALHQPRVGLVSDAKLYVHFQIFTYSGFAACRLSWLVYLTWWINISSSHSACIVLC